VLKVPLNFNQPVASIPSYYSAWHCYYAAMNKGQVLGLLYS